MRKQYTTREESETARERETVRKRRELHGDRYDSIPIREGGSTKEENSLARKPYFFGTDGVWLGNRRTILLGRYPRTGVNGQTGVGGVFSNPVEQFGEKSLFNKEKWLPAARELPFKITHLCCYHMKKSPLHKYANKSGRAAVIGTLAVESRVRKQAWIRHGCNLIDGKKSTSQPLSFWTEQDILHYIKRYNLKISDVYGDVCYSDKDGNDVLESENFDDKLHCTGCQRSGCVFCCLGAHSKDDNRFLELKKLSPRQYEYMMGGGQWIDNPEYDPTAPEYDGEWKNWNPEKIWVPSKEGLGFKFVIDEFNKLYPNNKIKY